MDCLLLGQDHDFYSDVTTIRVSDKVAASISVGADPGSPSLSYKGDRSVPNEDALCVIENGGLVLMAVADAHFGHEASHTLIKRLYDAAKHDMSATAADGPSGISLRLKQMIAGLDDGPFPETNSESTLLVALFDRTTGTGHAVSFGDSTLAVVTAGGDYRLVNTKDSTYVSAGDGSLLAAGLASEFSASAGDSLVMFTDGVDECHYRHPATSIQPRHIVDVIRQAGGSADEVSDELANLALVGVDGHPGGQDNIALIVVQA